MNMPGWWPWMLKPRGVQYLVIEEDGRKVSARGCLNMLDDAARAVFCEIAIRACVESVSPTRDHKEGLRILTARSKQAHGSPEARRVSDE